MRKAHLHNPAAEMVLELAASAELFHSASGTASAQLALSGLVAPPLL
jgi:hypothetical protein